jgi:protoheme IX farnesyltransferase
MSILTTDKIKGFMSLSKPRITALLDLAAIAGVFLAYDVKPASMNLWNIVLMLIGGSLAASGCSILNGAIEVRRDSLMSRTSMRPTVTGEIGVREAKTLGLALIAAGVMVGLAVNYLTSAFILLGSIVYILVYTVWLKPRHVSNIVIGGLAGSAAVWAGYASVSGRFDFPSLILGLLVFMWTPGHFWSLALRLKEDYERAGYPMLPVLLDERKSALAIAISNLLMLPFALALFFYLGYIYLYLSMSFSAMLIYFSFRLLRNPTGIEAWRSFKISSPYLALILIAVIVSRI